VVEIRDSQYLETYRLQEPVDGALFRFEIAGCVGGTTSSDCGVCELELLGPDGFDIAPADGSFDAWGAAVRRAGQLAL